MRRILKIFGIAYIVLFPIAFLYQRYLEQTGNSDILGVWYTIYCALFWAVIPTILVTLGIIPTKYLK